AASSGPAARLPRTPVAVAGSNLHPGTDSRLPTRGAASERLAELAVGQRCDSPYHGGRGAALYTRWRYGQPAGGSGGAAGIGVSWVGRA
nr:hypothetical protein [Tanacetum cinerariifolium]